MSWDRNTGAVCTVGRRLGDGEMYIIDVHDMAAAGLLIRAYNQGTSQRHTLTVSEAELAKAGVSRSADDLRRLAESVDIYALDHHLFIHSTLEGIAKPKVIPSGQQARLYIQNIRVGEDSFEELLARGLAELCKIKPEGLEAVRWLGEWLLANNPNSPTVGEPDDEEPEAQQ